MSKASCHANFSACAIASPALFERTLKPDLHDLDEDEQIRTARFATTCTQLKTSALKALNFQQPSAWAAAIENVFSRVSLGQVELETTRSWHRSFPFDPSCSAAPALQKLRHVPFCSDSVIDFVQTLCKLLLRQVRRKSLTLGAIDTASFVSYMLD